jgi:nucleotide-binding universal stress UspA family protein
MRILLAIDDSKFSEAATQALIAQAKPKETEVRVLHVIEPLPLYPEGQSWGYTEPPRPVSEEERKDAEELVEQQGKRLREAGFQVTTAIEHGSPKLVIIDSAKEWRADLVILGSHGRKGLERFLMGSVSEAVARHAPCSVQIVRIAAR